MGTACPLSGRNSTYRPVQISGHRLYILQHLSPGGFNLRLNWQRVGIVASLVWAIVGVFLAEQILYSLTYRRFDTCTHTITSLSICVKNLNKDLANAEVWRWGMFALVALAPIPIAWLVVYGLIIFVRWIRRGFQISGSQT